MLWDRVLVGAVRAFHFVRLVMPVVLHYKFKQNFNRIIGRKVPDKEWEALHNHYAPKCLAIAERMQGFYIKVGQHLATTGLESLPNVYVENFLTLLEHCPAQPFSTVKAIVESELGPLARTFESFHEQPMNAASTGQVHCAKLWGGHDVVVKVQHPDAEWTFGVDVQLFHSAAQLLQIPGASVVEQVKENLASEFDYAREASQQREAANHVAGFPNIVVPLPVDRLHPQTPIPGGLCTKRLLVMDRLYGTSLADYGRAQLESEARSQGKTRKELQDELMQRPAEDLENMRPSAVFLTAYCMAIRSVDLAMNTPLFAYNWGLGYALGQPMEYVDTPLPPNIHHIIDELLAAQAHLIFRAGFVNCDPHAGNVMLLNDGRIALIDWGQVVRLTVEQRCLLAGLFIGLAAGDDPMTADCMRALGGRSLHGWDWTAATWGKIVTWSLKETIENDGPQLCDAMLEVDPNIREADSEFVMTFRNQSYTRQVAAMLGFPGVNSAVAMLAEAEECLRMAGWPTPQPRAGALPIPPEVQERIRSGKGRKRPSSENVDKEVTQVTKSVPRYAPGKNLSSVATVTVLATYALCSCARGRSAAVCVAPALLVICVLGALLLGPALGSYTHATAKTANLSELGDPAQFYGANGWELSCESRKEGTSSFDARWQWPLSSPLPMLLALSLLMSVSGRVATSSLQGWSSQVQGVILVYNAALVLYLARRAAAGRLSRPAMGLCLGVVYLTQHWVMSIAHDKAASKADGLDFRLDHALGF